jgi:hypothetical protein
MHTAGKAYVVRDADAGTKSGEVTQAYAYTLKGLTTALDDARFRARRLAERMSPRSIRSARRLPRRLRPLRAARESRS